MRTTPACRVVIARMIEVSPGSSWPIVTVPGVNARLEAQKDRLSAPRLACVLLRWQINTRTLARAVFTEIRGVTDPMFRVTGFPECGITIVME